MLKIFLFIILLVSNCNTTIKRETPILSEKAKELKQELENFSDPDKGFDEERFETLRKNLYGYLETSEAREKELINKLQKAETIVESIKKENETLTIKANKYDKIVLTFISIIICIVTIFIVYLVLKFKQII